MDLVGVTQGYLNAMFSSVPGIKVLLVDEATNVIVSTATTQSEIYKQQVFLLDRIESSPRASMADAKCVCFLRPVKASVDALCAELQKPAFPAYHVFFSNKLHPEDLQSIAQADISHLVRDIQEVFADCLPLDPHLFSMEKTGCLRTPTEWHSDALTRAVACVTATLRATRTRPLIRFQGSSAVCQTLAGRVAESLDGKPDPSALLLVLDRRCDAITPLCSQWTYQAMAHELLGVGANKYDLSKSPGISRDLETLVLSSVQDEFFASNMYMPFADLIRSVDTLSKQYKATKERQSQLDTLEDMKRFFGNYEAYKAVSGSAAKHVTAVVELKRLAQKHGIVDQVAELENLIVFQGDAGASWKALQALVQDPAVRNIDRVRMCMLFFMRFESKQRAERLADMLAECKVPKRMLGALYALSSYASRSRPERDPSVFKLAGTPAFKSPEESKNMLTEHSPLLGSLLERLQSNDLDAEAYPYTQQATQPARPATIVVFFVGGATYEEAKTVAYFNQHNKTGATALLGGTSLLNFARFCEEVEACKQ